MFEEVPRKRRGIAGVTARRVVLGPFVLGGGMVLAAVGGSVAVAATVITASTIVLSDVPPLSHPKAHETVAATTIPVATDPATAAVRTASAGSAPRSGTHRTALAGAPATTTDPRSSDDLASATPSTTPGSSSPALPPPITRPERNALVYVSGYDAGTGHIRYEFADIGTASDGRPRYRVSSPQRFSAGIAASVVVISGGTVCPPADSRCTRAQLIAASARGFFAEVAIDSSGQLRAVIEQAGTAAPAAPDRSAASPSPSVSASVDAPPAASSVPSASSAPFESGVLQAPSASGSG